MQKIDLPTKVDETTPWKPDINWWLKMIFLLITFLVIWFLGFYVFAYIIIWNISLEKEKEVFGWMLENQEEFSKFDKDILWNKLQDFPYNLYLWDNDEANAFATIWWNIAVTSWLLEKVKYKEEVLFVIWHEKGHIENRDPLRMFATNFPFQITISYIGYNIWFDFSQIARMMWNFMSKDMEIKADNHWIEFVKNKWLQPACILNFFQKDEFGQHRFIELFSTHPTTQSRINNLQNQLWKEIINFENCTKFEYKN